VSKPIVDVEPFAVRPKDGARIAGCGLTELYKRLNSGRYESFLDGTSRMITVRSIHEDQKKLLAAAAGTPSDKPSSRGRPKKSAQKNRRPKPRARRKARPAEAFATP